MVKARDGDKCMITGLQSSFFDPLIVAPIPRIRNSLNKYHVWQVWIGGPDRPSILDKVPMTTRGAFKNHSEHETWFPDKSSLQEFSRFTKAIRWYHISVETALKQQKPPPVSTALTPSFCHRLSEYSAVLFSAFFFRLMPSSLRAQIYRGL
ncbi:unnamed protein product [Fusarium graminearum]|nr:unnamed protein product [Fusarium graminearum]